MLVFRHGQPCAAGARPCRRRCTLCTTPRTSLVQQPASRHQIRAAIGHAGSMEQQEPSDLGNSTANPSETAPPSPSTVLPLDVPALGSIDDLKWALVSHRASIRADQVVLLLQRLTELWQGCPQTLLDAAQLGDVLPALYALCVDCMSDMQPEQQAQAAILLSQVQYAGKGGVAQQTWQGLCQRQRPLYLVGI